SDEYRAVEMGALYRQYLHREADPAGLANGVAFLAGGGTLEQAAAILVSSPEYLQRHGGGDLAGFLTGLYQDALGRPPEDLAGAVASASASGLSLQQRAGVLFAS